MSTDLRKQQKAVREKLEQSEIELHQLEAELGAVEGELDALAEKRPQFDALTSVCDSLENLEAGDAIR